MLSGKECLEENARLGMERERMFMVQNTCPKMLFKKTVFKNFARFTGKHLCWSHFLIKFQLSRHRCFAAILRSAFWQNTIFPYEYYYQQLILKY